MTVITIVYGLLLFAIAEFGLYVLAALAIGTFVYMVVKAAYGGRNEQ